MTTFFTYLFLILGLIFGSFFNVVGLRVPKKQPFVNARSMCPTCQKSLRWYELIPVFSYLLQKGKCRNCESIISWQYPFVELATGGLFVLSYQLIDFKLELIIALLLMSMLIIILVADSHYMVIPDRILLFFLPLFIVLRCFQPLDPWWSSVVGAVVAFVLIAVIIMISRGGMGAGDMKLFGLLGIVLGIKLVLLTFFLACLIGAVGGSVLMLVKIVGHKQPVPFGPSIVLAAIVTYFYGDVLLNWYTQLFH